MFERDGRPDILMCDAHGTITKHWVPMVEHGFVVYQDVMIDRPAMALGQP